MEQCRRTYVYTSWVLQDFTNLSLMRSLKEDPLSLDFHQFRYPVEEMTTVCICQLLAHLTESVFPTKSGCQWILRPGNTFSDHSTARDCLLQAALFTIDYRKPATSRIDSSPFKVCASVRLSRCWRNVIGGDVWTRKPNPPCIEVYHMIMMVYS